MASLFSLAIKRFQLGSFGSATDEVFNSGSNSCGIDWQTKSQEPPKHIGFNKDNDQFMDQVHQVTITVPASCGVYNKGSIELAFQTNTNAKRTNEAAGFDNLVIKALYPCEMNVRRALAARRFVNLRIYILLLKSRR